MRDSSALDPIFEAAGEQYGIDPDLLRAVAKQESGLNPGIRDSYQGAQGIMQILPSTARGLGINDPRDPAQAIPAAAKYLAEGYAKTGSAQGAVMYYHGGPDQRVWGPKTHAYVEAVGSHYGTFTKGQPQMASKPSYVDDLVKLYGSAPEASSVPVTSAASSGGPAQDDIDALVKTYGVLPDAASLPKGSPPASAPLQPPVYDRNGRQLPPMSAEDMAAIKAAPPVQQMPARIESLDDVKAAAAGTAGYVGGQVAGIPAAIGSDYKAGIGMIASGAGDIAQGNYGPSFPSSDPRTWEAGGALKVLGGGAGALGSLVSGPVNKLVQQPITEATGNPDIGERAGVIANGAGSNFLIGKLMGSKGATDPETLRLANVADKSGIPIRASQITTNPLVQKLDQAAGWLPGSGRQGENAAQQSAFTKAVAKTFGENTDQITRGTIRQATDRIGGTLNEIEARTPIKFDNSVMDRLGAIENDAARAFTPDSAQYRQVKNQIDQIVNVAAQHGGVVPGDVWAKFSHYKSPLSRLADSADTDVGGLASDIKSVMQDAVQQNASGADGAAYTAARLQYKNMKTVEPLVTKGTPGEISPLGLNQRVNAKFGTTNAGQLGELADAAQRFLRPPRDSGTPLGNFAINALTGPGALISGAIGGAGYAGMSLPQMAAMGAGAGATALTSRAASMMLNNPLYRNALLREGSGAIPGVPNRLVYGALPNAPTNPPQLERKVR